MKRVFLLLLLSGPVFAGDMPDLTLTPGDVMTSDLTVLCQVGYTKTVRNVPESEKRHVYAEYGMIDKHSGDCAAEGCEVDHLISLELGGSNDIKNLWPEPYTGKWNARVKDVVEHKLHALACAHEIPIEEAQRLIVQDWKSIYLQYYGEPKEHTAKNSSARNDG